ncbi:MAG: bifunctional riboflavin kinase/FAD synthetase [Prevotella sp.]|nr:bifunctional riboflavin kinase/FAD synthetase [Prevotella sp.]
MQHTNTHHPSPAVRYVATIGFFDGVHRGHQYLIRRLREEAELQGMQSMVITFDRHPREVLGSNYQPRMLSTLDEKMERLKQTGVDRCVVLPFTRELAALSAREFMQQVLKRQLNVARLYMGYDNRFGHNREEGFDDYVRYGREIGIEVILNDAFTLNQIHISSSVVRSFVSEGEIELANQCLGYPYMVTGKVVDGVREGRKMGFPTANIEPDDAQKLIPAPGVYAVRVSVEGSREWLDGMMNIGTRPTFGENKLSLETHILHFSDDIYGKKLTVAFVKRLRAEQRFSSVAALREQLVKDEQQVEDLFRHS